MAMRGPTEQFDAEAMFLWWFNDGERKTLTATAEHFGCGYTTVREYADRHDWDGRAEDIDSEARRILAKRLGRVVAKQRSVHIDAVRAVQSMFLRRLPEKIQGPNGEMIPNPDRLAIADIEISDFERMAKLFELLTGGVTDRFGSEEQERLELDAIEQEIAALDRAALERGETVDV